MMALLVNGEGIQKEAIKRAKKKKRRKEKVKKKNRNERKSKKKRTDRRNWEAKRKRISQVWKCNGMENAGGMTADSAGRGWNSGMSLIVLCSWMSSAAAILNEVDR